MTTHSFLPESAFVLRSMIYGILESYENPWDLAAELAQNSMDAIRKAGTTKGRISAHFDVKKKSIEWSDNGTGIDPAEIDDLFVIYGTNKRGDPASIGEKGVGLKFAIFSTNYFEVVSHHKNGSFKLSVSDANKWLGSDGDENISLVSEKIDNLEGASGLSVVLHIAGDRCPLFDLSFGQLKNVLLTRTAIGSTKYIWEDADDRTIDLAMTNKAGDRCEEEFDCRFRLPIDVAKKKISVSEFEEWSQGGLKTDDQKRKKLKNSLIYNQGTYTTNREIKYWSCMAPTRTQWVQFAIDLGVFDEDDKEDFSQEEHFFVQAGGVYLATKSMPTGVTIDLRASGEAGYTDNFFIVIEDDSLSFDIGRKGIAGRTAGVLRKIAQKEFLRYRGFKRFLRGEAAGTNPQFERDSLFDDIKALPDLKTKASKFRKRPNGQEATVAAIFYEQLGKGHFEGFEPFISGYRDRYDLTGEYAKNRLIIEFKYDLAGLFADFSISRKMFDEINVLVVWEITEADLTKAEERGIDVEDLEDDERIFPETNKALIISDVAPIEVLELKKLLDA